MMTTVAKNESSQSCLGDIDDMSNNIEEATHSQSVSPVPSPISTASFESSSSSARFRTSASSDASESSSKDPSTKESSQPSSLSLIEQELKFVQFSFDEYIMQTKELEKEMDKEILKLQEELIQSYSVNEDLMEKMELIRTQLLRQELALHQHQNDLKRQQSLRTIAEQEQDTLENQVRQYEMDIQALQEENDEMSERIAYKESEIEDLTYQMEVIQEQCRQEIEEYKMDLQQNRSARLTPKYKKKQTPNHKNKIDNDDSHQNIHALSENPEDGDNNNDNDNDDHRNHKYLRKNHQEEKQLVLYHSTRDEDDELLGNEFDNAVSPSSLSSCLNADDSASGQCHADSNISNTAQNQQQQPHEQKGGQEQRQQQEEKLQEQQEQGRAQGLRKEPGQEQQQQEQEQEQGQREDKKEQEQKKEKDQEEEKTQEHEQEKEKELDKEKEQEQEQRQEKEKEKEKEQKQEQQEELLVEQEREQEQKLAQEPEQEHEEEQRQEQEREKEQTEEQGHAQEQTQEKEPPQKHPETEQKQEQTQEQEQPQKQEKEEEEKEKEKAQQLNFSLSTEQYVDDALQQLMTTQDQLNDFCAHGGFLDTTIQSFSLSENPYNAEKRSNSNAVQSPSSSFFGWEDNNGNKSKNSNDNKNNKTSHDNENFRTDKKTNLGNDTFNDKNNNESKKDGPSDFFAEALINSIHPASPESSSSSFVWGNNWGSCNKMDSDKHKKNSNNKSRQTHRHIPFHRNNTDRKDACIENCNDDVQRFVNFLQKELESVQNELQLTKLKLQAAQEENIQNFSIRRAHSEQIYRLQCQLAQYQQQEKQPLLQTSPTSDKTSNENSFVLHETTNVMKMKSLVAFSSNSNSNNNSGNNSSSKNGRNKSHGNHMKRAFSFTPIRKKENHAMGSTSSTLANARQQYQQQQQQRSSLLGFLQNNTSSNTYTNMDTSNKGATKIPITPLSLSSPRTPGSLLKRINNRSSSSRRSSS